MRRAWVVCAVGALAAGVRAGDGERVVAACPALPRDADFRVACAHVRTACAASPSAHYLRLYYCAGAAVHPHAGAHEVARHPVGLVLLLVSLLFLFSVLGLVAGDFFCPNLSSLAVELGMSDSTVGVTLLAFGNGLPDVVSTFRAMQEDAAAMALGELMGAAVFTVSAVCGSILVFHDFRVHPYVLVRDVGMYALAVALTIYFLRDGRLDLAEGLAMLALYVCFVVFVFVGDLYVDPRLGAEAADVERLHEHTPLLSEPALWPRYDAGSCPASPGGYGAGSHPAPPGASDARAAHSAAVSRASSPAPPVRKLSLPVWYGSEAYGRERLRAVSPEAGDVLDRGWAGVEAASPGGEAASPGAGVEAAAPAPLCGPTPHIHVQRPSVDGAAEPGARLACGPCGRSSWARVLGVALFPSLMCWASRRPLQRVLGVVSVPALLPLRVTVPLVSREEVVFHEALAYLLSAPSRAPSPTPSMLDVCTELEAQPHALADRAYLIQTEERARADRVLVALQCALVPALVLHVLGVPQAAAWRHAAMGAGAAAGGVLGVGVARRMAALPGADTSAQLQRCALLRSAAGFGVGLLWIVVSVDQVLALLHALGYVCGWSEAMLGLTLFALGNSLGDMVTNLSVARLGHPLMALSACFASPLTNLLLGIGASTTWTRLVRPAHGPFVFARSATLVLSSYTLLAMLVSLLVVLPLHGFRTNRTLGGVFLLTYAVVMATNVYLERTS
ncbi:hypothetical protein CBS9595_003870 [Malassezia furfur]|nr:hypothetical protein CBS9595_003870 [Malassezia furfur]